MLVSIDKMTNKAVGVNSPASPFLIGIEVPENFKLQKTAYIQDGDKQKTNESGQPLFTKEVFRIETVETVVGQDETLEDTGKPIMESVQKTNTKGEPLYLEPILDGNGEVADYMETTKAVDDSGQWDLAPVMIEVQKTSVSGKPLYWKDIIKVTEVPVLDHVEEVTEAKEPIAFEDKEITVQKVVGEVEEGNTLYEDTVITLKEPVEFKDLEPIMVPNMVPKFFTLAENPEEFTSEEIVQAKYEAVLAASGNDFIVADEFSTEDELDLTKPKLANTGAKLMELLPKGEVTFKPVKLDAPTKTLYLESLEVCNGCTGIIVEINGVIPIGGIYALPTLASEVVIRLVNTEAIKVVVNAYAVTYNEGV